MNRVSFLIDGFNLYHSSRQASTALGGVSTKWLDIQSLCNSSLSAIGGGSQIEGIYYFSALAHHMTAEDPYVVPRHQAFLDCLQDSGVTIELSRFKAKNVRCPHCGEVSVRHEEKETDVAVAVKLLELFLFNQCDSAVIVSGDTDLAPAVRTIQRLRPEADIRFGFPFGRKNKELQQLAPRSFKFSSLSYARHQFPDPFIAADGRAIPKPAKW